MTIKNDIPAYCNIFGYDIKFILKLTNFQNIITFLSDHNLIFLAEMKLDFNTIPSYLHGRGVSQNVFEYLAKNSNNNHLIYQFQNYFLNNIVNIKNSDSSEKIVLNFQESENWQDMPIQVQSIPVIPDPYIDDYVDDYVD
jgi:hypothetical protein